jgi:hypothetical protein
MRSRIALAFVVLAGAVVFTTAGSATQRLADATFKVFPGPGKVTYDELIAYRATFETKSTSTLNKVLARQTIPVAQGQEAVIDSHTCPTTPVIVPIDGGPDEWICNFGTVLPGAPKLVLTTVWRVPTLDQETICTDCLESTGKWTIKEGIHDIPNPNDTFGEAQLLATLIPKGDIPETNGETLLAGGYENASANSCAESSSDGNLKTHGVISLANPIITKYCLTAAAFLPPFIPVGSPDQGYASTITETLGNAQHTEVCIAKLGTDCGTNLDQNFFPGAVVTVVIQVADGFLDKGYQITTVSHNGVEMTAATCAATGDCVLDIDLSNGKFKVWTILLTSGSNGFYDF